MATTKTTDPRLALFKRYLQFFQQKPIEIELPQVDAGEWDEASVVVPHNFGQNPLVIAFITFPSVQAVGSDYTRFFGGSTVQSGGISGGNIITDFLMEEEIISGSSDIIFRSKVTNNTFFTNPAVTATIEYFVLTRQAPPAPV